MSMVKIDLKDSVDLIREVFYYSDRFKGKTFIIKLDYAVVSHPYFPILVKDLSLLRSQGIRIVIVPGAREHINEVLTRYGCEIRENRHIRISEPDSIPFIKMAAFDVSNQVMTQLSARSCPAVIGNWVRARALGVLDGVDYGLTGLVDKLDITALNKLLDEGYIPIFPCIGWSASGQPYNISSGELAMALSRDLQADKLFFVISADDLNENDFLNPDNLPVNEEGRLYRFSRQNARSFIDANSYKNDIRLDTLELALKASTAGVNRVHIVDGRIEGVILKEIYSNLGCGTMIHSNQYERIRPMKQSDIPDVLKLMAPFVEKKILVPRSHEDLELKYSDYVVYEMDRTIHGCGALHEWDNKACEIAGLAVDRTFVQLGIGQQIVKFLTEKAKKEEASSLFALTTQTSDWFLRLGFIPGSMRDLPESKARYYDNNRNSRVVVFDLKGLTD